jgi:quercetin dioxygenase-like cupin family protein
MPATGIHVSRVATIPWEDRINVDNWPSQAGMYHHDPDNAFTLRLINYPFGSTEPRHVHAGSHATTVLRGKAIVDGLTLGPLDVILGPSNEPHGPLHYPEGCRLLSAFQGSYYHSEVQQLSGEPQYRLIQAARLEWHDDPVRGCRVKTLVDHGLGRLQVEVAAFAAGASLALPVPRRTQALLVIEGSVELSGTGADPTPQPLLGEWDFLYLDDHGDDALLRFGQATTLLMLTLR